MRVQRVPLLVFGAVIALAIAAAGSYYGFFALGDGGYRQQRPTSGNVA